MKLLKYLFGFDFSYKTFIIESWSEQSAFNFAFDQFPGQSFALLEEII